METDLKKRKREDERGKKDRRKALLLPSHFFLLPLKEGTSWEAGKCTARSHDRRETGINHRPVWVRKKSMSPKTKMW